VITRKSDYHITTMSATLIAMDFVRLCQEYGIRTELRAHLAMQPEWQHVNPDHSAGHVLLIAGPHLVAELLKHQMVRTLAWGGGGHILLIAPNNAHSVIYAWR
jgi:hypothetical protein